MSAISSFSSSEEFIYSNRTYPAYGSGLPFTGIGQPNYGQETKFRLCGKSVTSLPRVAKDYAVALLSGDCPNGSYPFYRFWDNEDTGNANYVTGTFDAGYQDADGTYMAFCFVPKDPASSTGLYGAVNHTGGVLANAGLSNPSGLEHQGWILSDDEDTDNSNEWAFSSGTGDYITRIQEFAFGTTNTQLFFYFYYPVPGGI